MSETFPEFDDWIKGKEDRYQGFRDPRATASRDYHEERNNYLDARGLPFAPARE